MIINGSPDISVLSVQIIYDLSGVNPIIILNNQSQGDNLAGVTYAFTVQSPTTTYIHEGNIEDPDETGVWTTHNLTDPWPRPFNSIEWGVYSFFVTAKDSNGNIYTTSVANTNICRPYGNLPTSKNTYGVASVVVQVKCDQARIYFKNTTNASYQGLSGDIGSSVLRVNFPMDDTGVVPAPFVGANFATALVPITYSGKGYQFLATSIYEYDFGNDTAVRIKYLKSDTFGVWCNIDLMPLVCEYQKLISSIETGSCVDVEAANQKLMLINPKFSMVMIGMTQPLTGIDVPALIEQIQTIGDFDCDCCNAASGIVPTGSSVFEGYNFIFTPLGGDIAGEFVVNGVNIELQASDIKYIFKICEASPNQTTAFSVQNATSLDGFTKTYCLNVDMVQLSEDMLNTIASDANLVNLFNAIVLSAGEGNFSLIVDGDCIFQSGATCDYIFGVSNVPASTTFALLTGIKKSGITTTYSYAFNLANLGSFQTYLNTLGIGTFVVTNEGGGNVNISTFTNSNDLQQLTYKISATTHIASLSSDCTGFVPISANQVVQHIINYLCALDDTQLVTSAAYEICYIDPASGTQQTSTVAEGAALATFITELLARGCDTINYVINLGAVNCESIKAQFPARIGAMQADDIFLSTKSGLCAGVNPIEAFYTMLVYGATNTDILTAFCNLVTLCNGGNPCAAYEIYYVTVEENSPASTIDLIVTFDHPDAVSNTIRYARIDNTVSPVYITLPGILPGDSPYTISGVDNGQYRVGIKPIYSDGRLCQETFFETPACTGVTSFSALYDGTNIDVTYTATSPQVKVNVNYPNGGFSSQIFTTGDTISITPPANVFGAYSLTMQAVCDEDSNFLSSPSAPVIVVISDTQTVLLEVINPRSASNNRITNVTGISGFTFGATINEGETQSGTHGAFTGPISVSIVQPASTGFAATNGLLLTVNGIAIECIQTPTSSLFPQTHSFVSRTYASTDIIQITYDYDICDTSPGDDVTINWEYGELSGNGDLAIDKNGVQAVGTTTTESGNFPANGGDSIDIELGVDGGSEGILTVVDDTTATTLFSDSSTTVLNYNFITITGHTYTIEATVQTGA